MKQCKFKLVVLLLLLVIIAIPLTISALEEPPVTRVQEVVSLRSTNSETYLLSDGSYECVIYAYDKYYYDNTGSFRQIDNSIIPDESDAKATGLRYKNRANRFDVSFSDSVTPTVTMVQDGQTLTFSADSATGGNPFHTTADQQAVRLGAVNSCSTLSAIAETGSNTITYANAFYNTDIVYTLHNHALKEYIILKNNHAPNEITFLFSTEGLTLKQSGNTAVFLDKKGTEVFALGQLFAIDANGEYTDALTYTFTPVKGTENTLVTVTLDKAYLNATTRAFPVVIDPTLEISSTKNPDASVYSAHPDTNYKYDNRLRTGKESSYGKCRSYIAFTMPTNISSGQVTEATLSLRKYSGSTPAARAYRCEGSWTSGSITWNNMPAYTVVNISFETMPRSSGSSWYEMDVTDMVKYWLNNPSLNYGCVIRDNQENNTSQWTSFYSCDGTSSRIPELHIIYTEEVDDPVVPGEGDDSTIPDPIIPPDDEPDISFPYVNLNMLYDGGYFDRFSNASQRINLIAPMISEFYMTEFSLIISPSLPLMTTSLADSCGNTYDAVCTHGGNYDGIYACTNSNYVNGSVVSETIHHKNLYNILYHMSPPTGQNTFAMLFTGHATCQNKFGFCQPNGHMVSLQGLNEDALHISTVTWQESMEYEAVVAIHEFGHFFGAPDHDGEGDRCLYGNDGEDMNTINSIVICSACRETMTNEINKYR